MIDDLALLLDLSPAFIGLLERGQRSCKMENYFAICELFDISIYELFDPYLLNPQKQEKKLITEEQKLINKITSLVQHMNLNQLKVVSKCVSIYFRSTQYENGSQHRN